MSVESLEAALQDSYAFIATCEQIIADPKTPKRKRFYYQKQLHAIRNTIIPRQLGLLEEAKKAEGK